jgi:hypothetical protein
LLAPYFLFFYAKGGHFHCSSFEALSTLEESSQSNSGANHKALVSVVCIQWWWKNGLECAIISGEVFVSFVQ